MMKQSHNTRVAWGLATIWLVGSVAASTHLAAAQNQAAVGSSRESEATALTPGWTLLAQGQPAKASQLATALMSKYPRSVAVLALAIEAETARAGPPAGLDTYERWLNHRSLEDGYALRLVAQALLREAVTNRSATGGRLEAVVALRADGDPLLPILLASADTADLTLRAAGGSEQAVDQLLGQLDQQPGPGKRAVLLALGTSHNRRAAAPLVAALQDVDPIVRETAAQALGTLGASDGAAGLRSLLNDPVFGVHLAAASALLALNDTSGETWLRDLQGSEHAAIRLAGAEALKDRRGADWIEVVRQLTTDSDPEVRRQAAELIAPYDSARARATLDPLLDDPNPAERQAAQESNVRAVSTDFAALRRYLRSDDAVIRTRAAVRILELTR